MHSLFPHRSPRDTFSPRVSNDQLQEVSEVDPGNQFEALHGVYEKLCTEFKDVEEQLRIML